MLRFPESFRHALKLWLFFTHLSGQLGVKPEVRFDFGMCVSIFFFQLCYILYGIVIVIARCKYRSSLSSFNVKLRTVIRILHYDFIFALFTYTQETVEQKLQPAGNPQDASQPKNQLTKQLYNWRVLFVSCLLFL